MSKRLLLFVCILMSLLVLSSCAFVFPDNDTSDDSEVDGDGSSEKTGAIFGVDVDTYIIKSANEKLDLYGIIDRIFVLCAERAVVNTDQSPLYEHEIVFGNTSRAISAKANSIMQKRIEDDEFSEEDHTFTSYYCIYSDGASVAIVWSDDYSRDKAIEHFTEKYLDAEKLVLNADYRELVSFSRIESMREEEAAEREAAYAEISEAFGEEVLEALKRHFSIYDERYYLWLSDLYEPGDYDDDGNALGGGFYYSNSARNTPGYLIDIESTKQALNFLQNSGMLRGYGGSLERAIPERMQNEMIAFARSLQSSENGYFYHPQWGTAITASRLSRDMGWATSLLKEFGEMPYWNAPNGTKGIYGEPGTSATALTERLRTESRVAAVSSVISAANVSKWPERLRSVDNWRKYLEGFASTIGEKSYSIGNEVAEQSDQILNREAEAIQNGEATGYVAVTAELFNKWQNPENGLWESGVNYDSINGLMKIMAIYNDLGIKLEYADKAFKNAVYIINLEEPDETGKEASNSVDVYNPWISLTRIITNIKTHGSAETVEALQESIRENAAEMITITTAKTAQFKKDDGSFGYSRKYSPAKSQDAPAAVPNTVEGDVNGGGIAVNGVTGNMMAALGISGLYVFYPSDFEIFIDRTLGHVRAEKDNVELVSSVDFEYEEVGETSPFCVSTELSDGSVEIVESAFGGGTTKALRLTTVNDKGDKFTVANNSQVLGMSCHVLEWDMKFETIGSNSSTAMQVKVGNTYMLTFGVRTDGRLTFGDSSATSSETITNSFGGEYDAFTWHHIRIEHYINDGPMTKLFVDGTLVAESDNYLGAQNGEMPSPTYNSASFYALYTTNFTALFDNINLEKKNGSFASGIKKYDGKFDFEDTEIGTTTLEGLTTDPNAEDGNSISVAVESEDTGNKALRIETESSKTDGNWVNLTAPDTNGGLYVFETDIRFEELNRSKDTIQIFFRKNPTTTIFSLNMYVTKVEGGHTLYFQERSSDSTRTAVIGSVDTIIDGWFKLRIEYDPTTATATVIVNGETLGTTDAYYSEKNKNADLYGISLYATFPTDVIMYLDNITVEK